MGQKVSPIGMRVGVIRDWESRWYAEKADFGDLLNEDVKIRKHIEKTLRDAYVSRVEIERTGSEVHVVIRCSRPGATLGRSDDPGCGPQGPQAGKHRAAPAAKGPPEGADKITVLKKELKKSQTEERQG